MHILREICWRCGAIYDIARYRRRKKMKKSTTEVVKVLLASVAGTGMVIFGMWFMSGGVMLLPPWIVIPVFVLLFFVSVIVVGRKIHYKYILSVMASFVFGWFGFGALYKHTCGPNSADVKVMKPMAEAISSYIIKHGVPKSLEDIPGLPYRLEGCERKQENLEECYFNFKNNRYESELYVLGGIYIEIYNNVSQTGLNYSLRKNSEEKWKISKKAFGSNISGICNPMRQ
jgi:hypothetical protein